MNTGWAASSALHKLHQRAWPLDGASPIPVAHSLIAVDIPVMTAVAFACVPIFYSGRRVSRTEGALFVAAYAAYLTYPLVART